MNQDERVRRFRALHERGCFVMPNPWDIGTARFLRAEGFPALATTSAGFAFTQGRADQQVPLDMMLAHIAEIVAAVPDRPVNADFENGYADAPEDVATHVKACVATGVAGLSIEDATGRPGDPLYPLDVAVQRIAAARRAIDETGSGVLLTARAECFLTGHPDALAESVRRLQAYAAAGADVLYAPGPKTGDDIAAIVAAVAPKPVNVLVHGLYGIGVADIEAAGGRRISIGAALARAAWAAFITAARGIRDAGSFEGFAANGVTADLNPFFRADLAERGA
jgi:2-methylisocitrate lyase-like PEP mutase family enzyme